MPCNTHAVESSESARREAEKQCALRDKHLMLCDGCPFYKKDSDYIKP